MRIALIGYGSIGARHARLLLKHVAHIVVLSQRRDIPAPLTAVRTWEALRDAGSYDAIFVTNETVKHAATLTKALTLKPRAVFIEKPLAMNAKEAARMAAALKRTRTSAWVGYCLQWLPPLQHAKRVVEAGTLGRIHALRAFVGQDLRDWRARDYGKSYSAQAAQGGGVLRDLIHEINYPAWLLGEPLRMKEATVSHAGHLKKMDAETLVESTHVTPSGVLVQIHQDCLRVPGRRTLEIAGSSGTLWWDSLAGTLTVSTHDGKTKTVTVRPKRDEMYVRQLAAFFKKLKSKTPFSNIPEAVADMRVIDAIRTRGRRA